MTREPEPTRAILEAAIAALPALLRVDGCAVLLSSADRNALRTVARRGLSEPQAHALVELLARPEVSKLLETGRPFLPGSPEGISPAAQARLRDENWPDLIAVPLAGTGRPTGALVAVPDGDGHWTPGRVNAAMQAGAMLAVALRTAVRAGEGERRRRQVAGLLDRLPLIRAQADDVDSALAAVVAGLGGALDLSHVVAALVEPRTGFAEFCQPGVTPIGAPVDLERHPLWELLSTGGEWVYDDTEASPADRSATGRLLSGAHPRTVLAAPVRDGGAPVGVLLLVRADRRRTFGDEERAFVRAAAGELAAALGRMPAVESDDAGVIERAERRAHQLTTLNDVLLSAIAPDLASACSGAMEAITRNLPVFDGINIWLLDPGGRTLSRVSSSRPEDVIAPDPAVLPLDQDASVTRVVREGRAQVWQRSARRMPARTRERMHRFGLASVAVMPMRTAHGVMGALTLGSAHPHDFDPEELTFLETLAGQLGSQLDVIQTQERAESERRRLASLLATAPEGIVMVDGGGRVVLHNPVAERILGTPLAGSTLTGVLEAMRASHIDGRPFAPSDLPPVRALAGEALTGVEMLVARDDGTELPLLISAGPVPGGQRRVSGAVCVFQDMTPVRELSSLKNDFVNTVSHELRTPITTIRGGALTLLKRRQFLDEQTQNELLTDIADEAERLHLLVEDLLALTRSRQGMRVEPEPVLLHRLVNRVILELGGRVGSHSVGVNVPVDLPPVEVDPELTAQVLRNLLENAVKFSPRGGQIDVAAEVDDGTVVVSVLDRGSGVPPKDMDHVFEPFYRTDYAVRAGAQGAGLGLAVARRLVEMQGGRIWAEARPDGGAAFRFTVPVARE